MLFYDDLSFCMQVDILHPYISLEWTPCRRLPIGMRDLQAVWLQNKVYAGGGMSYRRDAARLYIYTPTTNTWCDINTPVSWFALIIYHFRLVLVGGREYVGEWRDGPVTNKLWTLTEHDQWIHTLPPMIKCHYLASAVEFANNILVAGGKDDGGRITNIVEVYNGHHWAIAQPLPQPCCLMKSTVLNGQWYLMGGLKQEFNVYHASLDSLVASCQASGTFQPYIWKRLSYDSGANEHSSTHSAYCSAAVLGKRLIAIGGEDYKSPVSSIHAYSPYTQSWVHVGDIPVRLGSVCTIGLPTRELMVIGGGEPDGSWSACVYKASLNGNGNCLPCLH